MLPFLMFASPSTSPTNHSPRLRPLHSIRCHPERSEGSTFRLSSPRALSVPAFCSDPSPFKFALSIEAPAPVGTVNFPWLSPFPATLTDRSQLTENPATLSPVSATLTDTVAHNPFVCHSYRKHRGRAYTFQPGISFRSLTTRHSPLATISFIIRTSKTQHLNSFRMNTSEKTGRGVPLVVNQKFVERFLSRTTTGSEESLVTGVKRSFWSATNCGRSPAHRQLLSRSVCSQPSLKPPRVPSCARSE